MKQLLHAESFSVCLVSEEQNVLCWINPADKTGANEWQAWVRIASVSPLRIGYLFVSTTLRKHL